MCQHNLPCSIVYAHCLLPGRAFASLYVLLFLEEAVIGGREYINHYYGDRAISVLELHMQNFKVISFIPFCKIKNKGWPTSSGDQLELLLSV